MAIENMLSIGLIICEEDNNYYLNEHFLELIKKTEGNLLKRKNDKEVTGLSKKSRKNINLEDENEENDESSNDDEVIIFL